MVIKLKVSLQQEMGVDFSFKNLLGNKEPTLIAMEVNSSRQHYRLCYGFARHDAFTKVLSLV